MMSSNAKEMKQTIVLYGIIEIVMILIGIYFLKIANKDIEFHECRSEYWLRIIAWIIIIIHLLRLIVALYLYNKA